MVKLNSNRTAERGGTPFLCEVDGIPKGAESEVKKNGYHVAVVGATGAVGEQMVRMLEQRNFPVEKLTLLASKRSAGKTARFGGEKVVIQEASPERFQDVDIAFFSAGGSVSKELAPKAVERGAVVIDNTSAFRMDPDVPLVVPEVNEKDLLHHHGVIANPNCSTIQLVVALDPIRKRYGLRRILASTYQAVSGAGARAVAELLEMTRAKLEGREREPEILPARGDKKHYPIAFNAIPQIDLFHANGFTIEEMKMVNETKKIMHIPDLKISVTCVRIPVVRGHSESVYFEVENGDPSVEEIRSLLQDARGIVLEDRPEEQLYPMPLEAEGRREVFVGRIRKDLDVPGAFHMWVVSDNLLKGAAWNAVQIAESLLRMDLFG